MPGRKRGWWKDVRIEFLAGRSGVVIHPVGLVVVDQSLVEGVELVSALVPCVGGDGADGELPRAKAPGLSRAASCNVAFGQVRVARDE